MELPLTPAQILVSSFPSEFVTESRIQLLTAQASKEARQAERKVCFILFFILFIYLSWSRIAVQCSVYFCLAAAAAKSLQSRPPLCDPTDSSPPGSPVPGILQARTLEWVAISFSSAWKWKVKVKSLSHVRLFMTPLTAAHQAPPSMGFPRQEYWSGVPLPSPYFCLTIM